jgi:hypothetical protein
MQFADEARAYASPLYQELSRVIAHDPELLRIARHVRRPPVPNVFFAAVHFLLLESPNHGLAAFYRSLTSNPRPPAEARDALREFVLSNRARLIPLLETRITQTNEVSRCSLLLPAFTHVYCSCGNKPLALIDVGCSAGLHLRWDRYHYDYGCAEIGDRSAPVSLTCELRGDVMPPLPAEFPACAFRRGIDLHPIDLANDVERRWFDALIWPDHPYRRRLAQAAIDELLHDPPVIVKGDAANVLQSQLDAVPDDTALVVYNVAALCQGGAIEETAMAEILAGFSTRRSIHWLYCERLQILLRHLDRGQVSETKLANIDGHGRWLEWLRS